MTFCLHFCLLFDWGQSSCSQRTSCWTGTSINNTELRLATVIIDTFEKKSIARKAICIWPFAKISVMQLRTLEHVLQLSSTIICSDLVERHEGQRWTFLIKKERNIKISLSARGRLGWSSQRTVADLVTFSRDGKIPWTFGCDKSFYQNRCKSLIWIFFWWGRFLWMFLWLAVVVWLYIYIPAHARHGPYNWCLWLGNERGQVLF